MRLVLLSALVGGPVLGAAEGGVDLASMLVSYGVAAPFAALCWWQMQRSQKQLDEARKEVKDLQEQAVARERDLIARVAPMIYDGARLYEKGNEHLIRNPPASPELEGLMRELVAKLQER